MSAAKKSHKLPVGLGESAQSFEQLRCYTHSLKLEERHEAINALGSMNDPDATRELIQLFRDCQWRATQMKILDVLSVSPTQRGLEFLFQHARNSEDLPMAEAAIRSLGFSRHVLAACFLTNLYRHCSPLLKPAIVSAVGMIPDRALCADFLRDLPQALRANQYLLARHLILTLGELKVREALPYLAECVTQDGGGSSHQLSLCALISIGKIARQPSLLEFWGEKFRADALEYQIYNGVKTQVYHRSQWRLEDYLKRIFESPTLHPSLPYELHHFNAADVKEGLKLYNTAPYFKRLCQALAKLDVPDLGSWYLELCDISKLSSEQLSFLFESMSAHTTQDLKPLLQTLGKSVLAKGEALGIRKWFECVSLCLPKADEEFLQLYQSGQVASLTEEIRIALLNAIGNFGLSVQANAERLQGVSRLLECLLFAEKSPLLQGRILRLCGVLGVSNRRITDFLKTSAKNPLLSASCIYYLEQNGEDRLGIQVLRDLLLDAPLRSSHAVMLLRALRAVPQLPENFPELDELLWDCLSEEAPIENCNGAIQLLAKHPRAAFLKELLRCLNVDPRLCLNAVIALRGYKDESIADSLAPFLSAEDSSLRGRTLDTLCHLPGLRAKRLVLDYFKDHAEDLGVCDQILRYFAPPSTAVPYFAEVIQGVLEQFPKHPRLDGLLDLKLKLSEAQSLSKTSQTQGVPKGVDAVFIDQSLSALLKGYKNYEESTKSVLRSAEVPFLHPEMFDESVDKSSSVLGYCKALDKVLADRVGRKLLASRLENSLHEFQNILHALTLNEESPEASKVLQLLGLEKFFTRESLPLQKMRTVAQGILSGRILTESFRVLDGLRAWAVMLLIFGRPLSRGTKPLVSLKNYDDASLISFCKRLLALQEIRNQAAHRQTLQEFKTVGEVRTEVYQLLNRVEEIG